MMTSQEVLSAYEAMVELTEQMLVAAGNDDWDRFIALEQRCALRVQTLSDGEALPLLSDASRLKKIDIIKRILSDDRKIRDLTMPWMAQLSALIKNTGTERRLASAYGA